MRSAVVRLSALRPSSAARLSVSGKLFLSAVRSAHSSACSSCGAVRSCVCAAVDWCAERVQLENAVLKRDLKFSQEVIAGYFKASQTLMTNPFDDAAVSAKEAKVKDTSASTPAPTSVESVADKGETKTEPNAKNAVSSGQQKLRLVRSINTDRKVSMLASGLDEVKEFAVLSSDNQTDDIQA